MVPLDEHPEIVIATPLFQHSPAIPPIALLPDTAAAELQSVIVAFWASPVIPPT
jgi:hypothetical protein